MNSAATTGMTGNNAPELYVVLGVASRGALDGVSVDTSYDAATIGDVTALSAEWFMEGKIANNNKEPSAPITINIICG